MEVIRWRVRGRKLLFGSRRVLLAGRAAFIPGSTSEKINPVQLSHPVQPFVFHLFLMVDATKLFADVKLKDNSICLINGWI